MIKPLPIMQIGDTSYYVDDRLNEFRNVNNPHDRLNLAEAVAKGLGLDGGFCGCCGCLIVLNIEKFKAQNCISCEPFLKGLCRGVSEEISECKECCESSFTDDLSNADSGFWGEPDNHNEDREESDLP